MNKMELLQEMQCNAGCGNWHMNRMSVFISAIEFQHQKYFKFLRNLPKNKIHNTITILIRKQAAY